MSGVDIEAIKQREREVWALGAYEELAKLTWPAAEAVVELAAISAGQEVLDVAAGTGNVAVIAAREGAAVVASDLVPEMVEKGRARTEAEGLDVEWMVADAEELPFEDARFDCVTSVFGAMFAPRPERVASELFRVVRPGSTVGFVAWTPDSYLGRNFALRAKYVPEPTGVPEPTEWGREEIVRERFEGLAASVDFERRTARFAWPSLDEMQRFFAANAGPAIAAREALSESEREAMGAENEELVRELNQATDGSVLLEPEFLVTVARRRG